MTSAYEGPLSTWMESIRNMPFNVDSTSSSSSGVTPHETELIDDVPLPRLRFVGSHNSGSSQYEEPDPSLTFKSEEHSFCLRDQLGPDVSSGVFRFIGCLKSCLCGCFCGFLCCFCWCCTNSRMRKKAWEDRFDATVVEKMVRPWGSCQGDSIADQLRNGIRYLDIRIAGVSSAMIGRRRDGEEFAEGRDDVDGAVEAIPWISHTVYWGSLETQLHEIVEFVDEHPFEVVVVDFQHVREIRSLAAAVFIVEHLGQDRLYRHEDAWPPTLRSCRECGRRLIGVMRTSVLDDILLVQDAAPLARFFRSRDDVVHSRWFPNPDIATVLENVNDDALDFWREGGDENVFHVMQCVTPTTVCHWLSCRQHSLRDFALPLSRAVEERFFGLWADRLDFNIVMIDFTCDCEGLTRVAVQQNLVIQDG